MSLISILGWMTIGVLVATLAVIFRKWYYEFTVLPIRWPRKWKGWKALFWLFVHRCPLCHDGLRIDPWSYSDTTLYCVSCEGITMWPGDAIIALRQNYISWQREQAEEQADDLVPAQQDHDDADDISPDAHHRCVQNTSEYDQN